MKSETAADVGVVVLAALILLVGLVPEVSGWFGALFDDAYIYLHYAQNTLSGCALEWNCGHGRVEGFTSPLYLAALVILGAANVDLEFAAGALGMMSWFGALLGFSALSLFFLKRGTVLRRLAPLLIALSFAGDQLLAINITSGMEGGIVVLATLGIAALCNSPDWLRRLVPWAVLVRPELGLFTCFYPILSRDKLRRFALTAISVFGIITIGRIALFHDVLPNTFWAKSGGTWDHLQSGWNYVWSNVLRFPIPMLGILLGAVVPARPKLRYLSVTAAVWLLYFLWSGGDFYPYGRVFVFLVPLGSFLGVVAGISLVSSWPKPRAIVAILIPFVAGITLSKFTRDQYVAGDGFSNVRTWVATGKYLARCLPGAPIAAVPIGALAYFSNAPVFDIVGLTDPHVAMEGTKLRGPQFVVGHERSAPEWTLGLQPAVIFLNVAGDQPMTADKPPTLTMYPELEITQVIGRQRLPYEPYSIPVDGKYQLILVHKGARWAEDLSENGCL